MVGVARDTSGRTIPFAEAVLVGAKKKDRASDRGWSVLDSLEAGPDLLLVRAIGYKAQRFPISRSATDTLELEAVLPPQVQVLPQLTVRANEPELKGIAAEAAHRGNRGLPIRCDAADRVHHHRFDWLRRCHLAPALKSPANTARAQIVLTSLDGSTGS